MLISSLDYVLTPDLVDSITDGEVFYGTDRFLPSLDELPIYFRSENPYSKMVEFIYLGLNLNIFSGDLKPGYTEAMLYKVVRCHLRIHGLEYERIINGLAYLVSQMMTIKD